MLLIPAINLTSRVIIRRVNTVDGVRRNTVDEKSQQNAVNTVDLVRKNTVDVRSQKNTVNTVDWGSGLQRDGQLNTKCPNPIFD